MIPRCMISADGRVNYRRFCQAPIESDEGYTVCGVGYQLKGRKNRLPLCTNHAKTYAQIKRWTNP
jgi:hypothetical protein